MASSTMNNLSMTSILDFCKNLSAKGEDNHTIFNQLLQILSPYNVKLNRDNVDGIIYRFILSPDKDTVNSYTMTNPQSCIIIDPATWSVVCAGPKVVTTYISGKSRNNKITKYDIIPIRDATTMTLYPWSSNIFCLATTHGFDVTPVKWISNDSYGQIFYELANQNAEFLEKSGLRLEMIKDPLGNDKQVLVSDILPKNVCHTFAVTSHKLHPFQGNKEGIVHVKSTSLDQPGFPEISYDFGIESQEALEPVDVQSLIKLNSKPFESITVHDLIGFCKRPLEYFVETPFYGFLLRSKGNDSDILLETELLKRIRQMVYQSIPKKVLPHVAPENRLIFITLRAFLHDYSRKDFSVIFPELSDRFNDFKVYIDSLVTRVINTLRGDTSDTFTINLINNSLHLNAVNNPVLVRDMLLNPMNTFILLEGYLQTLQEETTTEN
jgi:hypothetical protein